MRARKRILVVEDSPEYAARLERMLKRAGHVPVVAEDAAAALRALRAAPVDLVLSDILMPGADGVPHKEAGFELLASVRGECPGTPVALVTGFSVDEYIESALRYDVGNVLSKAAPDQEILRCIRMWTTGEGIFGLANYLPRGQEITRREFRSIREAQKLCDEVDAALESMDYPPGKRIRVRTMLDEITMNAIQHCRDDYEGKSQAPKELDAEMPSACLEYGGKADHFGIAVTDYLGRLTKQRVLASLLGVVRERRGEFDDTRKGDTGGRGIYITRAMAKEYYINVIRGEKTEVVLITDSSDGMLDVNRCSLKITEL